MQMRFKKKKEKKNDETIVRWIELVEKAMCGECVIVELNQYSLSSAVQESSSTNNSFFSSISILLHAGCLLIKLLPFKQ